MQEPLLAPARRLLPASNLSGELRVPADKSLCHRAALLGGLAAGTTRIQNFLAAEDTRATLACLRLLGVGVDGPDDAGTVVIYGRPLSEWQNPEQPLDCGNSGTTMRLLLGLLAGHEGTFRLHGDKSLSRRPMDRVQRPLMEMGARVSGQGPRCAPPISLQGGHLRGITYRLPVASAQVKTAILLAGLHATGVTTVEEPVATRDHTERMLPAFGVAVERVGEAVSVRRTSGLHPTDLEIGGDISSAAPWLAAAALRPGWSVTVRDLGVNPTRTGMLEVLRAMGAQVSLSDERLSGGEPLAAVTVKGAELKGTTISGALIPRLIDELPALAALATQARGTTIIRDAGELRVKESDRIAEMCRALLALGATVREQPDGMVIVGPCRLRGARIDNPPGDHRLAMAMAVASLVAEGETELTHPAAVNSSYPGFWEDLRSLHA